MSNMAGVHPQTLKKWHYKRSPIPFQKTTNVKQGKVFIEPETFRAWVQKVSALNGQEKKY